MCCDTKQKIAQALRQLMEERPLRKITVQNLMERTQMKRQSFYYHFRDIREVLEWICKKQLADPLSESDLDFEQWFLYALRLLDADRVFYRRVQSVTEMDDIQRFFAPIVQPRVAEAFFGTRDRRFLSKEQWYVVEYESKSMVFHLCDIIRSRKSMDETESAMQLRCLLSLRRFYGEPLVRKLAE